MSAWGVCRGASTPRPSPKAPRLSCPKARGARPEPFFLPSPLSVHIPDILGKAKRPFSAPKLLLHILSRVLGASGAPPTPTLGSGRICPPGVQPSLLQLLLAQLPSPQPQSGDPGPSPGPAVSCQHGPPRTVPDRCPHNCWGDSVALPPAPQGDVSEGGARPLPLWRAGGLQHSRPAPGGPSLLRLPVPAQAGPGLARSFAKTDQNAPRETVPSRTQGCPGLVLIARSNKRVLCTPTSSGSDGPGGRGPGSGGRGAAVFRGTQAVIRATEEEQDEPAAITRPCPPHLWSDASALLSRARPCPEHIKWTIPDVNDSRAFNRAPLLGAGRTVPPSAPPGVCLPQALRTPPPSCT